MVVANEFIHVAMKFVCTRLGDYVDKVLCPAILSLSVSRHHLEFPNGINRRQDAWSVKPVLFCFHAIDQPTAPVTSPTGNVYADRLIHVSAAFVLATVDDRSGSNAECSQLYEVSAVERQICDIFFVDDLTE